MADPTVRTQTDEGKPDLLGLVVIKATRTCNLRCPYCYYINEDTQDYGSTISEATLRRFYQSVAEYLRPGQHFEFVWHGGEPLLLGRRRFRNFINIQREYLRAEQVVNVMQTNGTLIDDAWAELFEELDVGVGVSLDGPPEIHDRRRPTVKGRGSYAETMRGIEILRKHGRDTGVLAVMDPEASGGEVINHFRSLGMPFCDLLIPITNHCIEAGKGTIVSDHTNAMGLRRYALDAFDAWVEGGVDSLSVRLFESLLKNAFGIPHGDLNSGARNIAENLILETDGQVCLDPDFWYVDRFAFGSLYRLNHSVHDPAFSLETVGMHLAAFAEANRLRSVPRECQRCSVRSICRGSHPASRFGSDGSFDHRSAYCDLMFALSSRVVEYLTRSSLTKYFVDPDLVQLLSLEPIAERKSDGQLCVN